MIDWEITVAMVLIAFALPFFFLWPQMRSMTAHVRSRHAEVESLRRLNRDLEEHLQRDKGLFLEALGVPFLLLLPSGRVEMGNHAVEELLGYPANVNILRLLPPGSLRDALSDAVQAEESRQYTVTLPHGGEDRTFRILSTPITDQRRHIGIVFHDITEEQRTLLIRRDFVANASHELRTPLTILSGYLENLQEDKELASDATARERVLSLMRKHTERLVRLVEDMLMVSRLENAETGGLHWEEFDLGGVLEDVRGRLEGLLRAQEVVWTTDFSPHPFVMRGDSFYWSQILFNLLENALKNNPMPGLELTVSARRNEDASCSVCVSDNGVGIEAKDLPYIFNRFYRADKTGRVKGTGLGLSIVKHAVEAHGGSIRAESSPGAGATFTITLPPTSEKA